MTTGTRLGVGAAIIAGVTGYLAYLGASDSWQYYLTVDECAADAPQLIGHPLRVNGRVALGSLHVNDNRSEAAFLLKGPESELQVVCAGPLPDNLAEDRDVVVEGRLEDVDLLRGEKVLTRCASKYRSSVEESPAPPDTVSVAERETVP